ncbi:peroxidase family protein [Planktotalea sp.]|uniref:peroxidase family protein n=1 Tax=Planktotalea sp. TaxID=2029877 RepID=UPI003D6B200A
MFKDYATWTGFQDASYTARHLPANEAFENNGNKPDPADLLELFVRDQDTGAQVEDIRSNLLFAAFAQWFTDSFLRTAHGIQFDEKTGNALVKDGRVVRDPNRVNKNESNHEIDLCQIYGMNADACDALRFLETDDDFVTANKGCLRFEKGKDGEYPESLLEKAPDAITEELKIKERYKDLFDERILRAIFSTALPNNSYDTIFAVGLEHGNATIGNTLFNVIFMRHHNWVARKIAEAYDDWDNDRVFHAARNTTMVLLLKVVISDYVRHISPLSLPFEIFAGLGDGENWHRTNRIHVEFNLLYRWHSLIPDEFPFLPPRDTQLEHFNQYRHNNNWLVKNGIAAAVDEFSKIPAGRMTIGNTPTAMRGIKYDTLKLMRDAKLDSYNAYRKRFNMKPAETFEDVTGEKVVSRKLSKLYKDDINALEWYVGMIAENHGHNMMMGDLMFNMVAHDAFTHAITNPLLAKDVFVPSTFSDVGYEVIKNTETLADMLKNVAPLSGDQIVTFRKPGA